MRCIEAGGKNYIKATVKLFNSNMRCIEAYITSIKLYTFLYLTVTCDVLKP